MHRIDGSGSVNGRFDLGDPGTGREATQVTPEWADDLQENVCRVIEYAGLTLEKGDPDQLRQAIMWIAASVAGGGGVEGAFLLLAGGTMTGYITLHAPPAAPMHAANKGYVDAAIAALVASLPDFNSFLPKAGGTMTGYIVLHADPTAPMHPVTLQYLQNALEDVTSPFTSKVRSGDLNVTFGNQIITFSHGLGGLPYGADAWLKCIAAEGGWSVGELLPVSQLYRNQNENGSYGEIPRQREAGAIMFKTDTQLGLRVFKDTDNTGDAPGAPSLVMLPHKTSPIYFTPTSAKWKVVFEACL